MGSIAHFAAGDWGYIVCQSVMTAAALEAAAEDVDISIDGYQVSIQSLDTANLYSRAQERSSKCNRTKSYWAPCAAYAVYPDDYPPNRLPSFPEDYLPEDDPLQDHLACLHHPKVSGIPSLYQHRGYSLGDSGIGFERNSNAFGVPGNSGTGFGGSDLAFGGPISTVIKREGSFFQGPRSPSIRGKSSPIARRRRALRAQAEGWYPHLAQGGAATAHILYSQTANEALLLQQFSRVTQHKSDLIAAIQRLLSSINKQTCTQCCSMCALRAVLAADSFQLVACEACNSINKGTSGSEDCI